jgi:hypothetical protein
MTPDNPSAKPAIANEGINILPGEDFFSSGSSMLMLICYGKRKYEEFMRTLMWLLFR